MGDVTVSSRKNICDKRTDVLNYDFNEGQQCNLQQTVWSRDDMCDWTRQVGNDERNTKESRTGDRKGES